MAGAAARQAGIAEEDLDDVRLAVAEVVGMAVNRCERLGAADQEIRISMVDEAGEFTVRVVDTIPLDPDSVSEAVDLALPLIRALAPEASLQENREGGQTVKLGWSLSASP